VIAFNTAHMEYFFSAAIGCLHFLFVAGGSEYEEEQSGEPIRKKTANHCRHL